MKFNSFFPTLVYQSLLQAPLQVHSKSYRNSRPKGRGSPPGGSLLREIHREALILPKIDSEGLEWSRENYPRGFTTYGSMDRLHQSSPTFQELEKKIDRHVQVFARKQNWDLDGGRLAMTTCWVNIMPSGAAHSLHLHPLSVVSGTFYVSLPKGASPIKFEDPRLDRFMAQPPRRPKSPRAIQPFVTLEPREGDVILFESWLRHEVPPLKEGMKGERISVSFNYGWV